jgi:hypothetical protein
MAGAIAHGLHEGSRSEYLVQCAFASWGTAVAIPHQEDHGIDLACTLLERAGRRSVAKWSSSKLTALSGLYLRSYQQGRTQRNAGRFTCRCWAGRANGRRRSARCGVAPGTSPVASAAVGRARSESQGGMLIPKW